MKNGVNILKGKSKTYLGLRCATEFLPLLSFSLNKSHYFIQNLFLCVIMCCGHSIGQSNFLKILTVNYFSS